MTRTSLTRRPALAACGSLVAGSRIARGQKLIGEPPGRIAPAAELVNAYESWRASWAAYSPKGELAMARGASEAKTLIVVSDRSSYPVDQIAAQAKAPFWYQVYAEPDVNAVHGRIDRAVGTGCKAVIITDGIPDRNGAPPADWSAIDRFELRGPSGPGLGLRSDRGSVVQPRSCCLGSDGRQHPFAVMGSLRRRSALSRRAGRTSSLRIWRSWPESIS